MIDITKLTSFLNEANKHTYASKDAAKAASLRPSSQDYHYEKGNLAYHDTYFGARDFIGEEVVYKDEIPVWALNYYGFVLTSDVSEKDVYAVLRRALMQEYDDIIPVRGPRDYRDGEYAYTNTAEGDLGRFFGTEEIYQKGDAVYRCLYHGGFIL